MGGLLFEAFDYKRRPQPRRLEYVGTFRLAEGLVGDGGRPVFAVEVNDQWVHLSMESVAALVKFLGNVQPMSEEG